MKVFISRAVRYLKVYLSKNKKCDGETFWTPYIFKNQSFSSHYSASSKVHSRIRPPFSIGALLKYFKFFITFKIMRHKLGLMFYSSRLISKKPYLVFFWGGGRNCKFLYDKKCYGFLSPSVPKGVKKSLMR